MNNFKTESEKASTKSPKIGKISIFSEFGILKKSSENCLIDRNALASDAALNAQLQLVSDEQRSSQKVLEFVDLYSWRRKIRCFSGCCQKFNQASMHFNQKQV